MKKLEVKNGKLFQESIPALIVGAGNIRSLYFAAKNKAVIKLPVDKSSLPLSCKNRHLLKATKDIVVFDLERKPIQVNSGTVFLAEFLA